MGKRINSLIFIEVQTPFKRHAEKNYITNCSRINSEVVTTKETRGKVLT